MNATTTDQYTETLAPRIKISGVWHRAKLLITKESSEKFFRGGGVSQMTCMVKLGDGSVMRAQIKKASCGLGCKCDAIMKLV